jgi:hypothetical protein
MLMLGLLVCAVVGDLPEGWVAIKANNLGYVVSMPKPERKAFQELGPDEKPVHISYYKGTSGKTSFIVSVTEFSKIFDTTRDKSLTRTGGTLVSEKEIKFNTIPGCEIIVQTKDAGYVKSRLFVYNLRLYTVMVSSATVEDLENKEAKLFFDSFELKPLKRTIK